MCTLLFSGYDQSGDLLVFQLHIHTCRTQNLDTRTACASGQHTFYIGEIYFQLTVLDQRRIYVLGTGEVLGSYVKQAPRATTACRSYAIRGLDIGLDPDFDLDKVKLNYAHFSRSN